MFTSLSDSTYSSWKEVFDLVGERIPVVRKNKRLLGYTRVLTNPVLLLVTRDVPVEEFENVLKVEGADRLPCIHLLSKETMEIYDEMFSLLYPITNFWQRLGVRRGIYSNQDLVRLLEYACDILSGMALERDKILFFGKYYGTATEPSPSPCYDDLYLANEDHPDYLSLVKIHEESPELISDSIVLSPTGLPFLWKWIPSLKSPPKFPGSVLLYEVGMIGMNPELCFISYPSKIPGIHARKEKFIKSTLKNCIGKWIKELDFSKSSITGGIMCCVLSILFAYPDMDLKYVYEKYEDSDVDVAVSCSEEELEETAHSHHSVIKRYWPSCVISKNKNKFKITSIPEDYLEGFRDVDIYQTESKYSCLAHHLPMVRAFYDGEIQLSFSCLESQIWGKVVDGDYRLSQGEIDPKEIKQKYKVRGFDIPGTFYRIYQRRLPEKLSDWTRKFMNEETRYC